MIFAPDGTVIDRDALRSVGFGTGRQPTVRVDRDTDTKTVEVINEDTGGTAGWHAHKADGRTVNTPEMTEWVAGIAVAAGERFGYGGATWECVQAHTTQKGWEPDRVPSLWRKV